jgi:AI-2 transport protein TqsA
VGDVTPGVEPTGVVPRGLLILGGVAAVTIVVAGLRGISSLAAPAFLAAVLTVAVHPLRGWLERRRVPRSAGTLAVIVAVYLILLGLTVSLFLAAARLASLLPQYEDEFTTLVTNLGSVLSGWGVGPDQVDDALSGLDLGTLAGWFGHLLAGTLSALTSLAFVVTLLLFMALDAAWFPHRLEVARVARPGVVHALESFAHGTRSYLLVSTAFGLIVAVIDTLLLWALGVPAPLVWGLLAFVTNFIPNIGFVIGLIPPAILALLDGGAGLMMAVIVSYSVINVLIQSVIQPKIVGDVVGLSTSVTFLSLVFWAWVLGPLGALLAIPLTLLLRALLIDVDPGARWARPLISGADNPDDRPRLTRHV